MAKKAKKTKPKRKRKATKAKVRRKTKATKAGVKRKARVKKKAPPKRKGLPAPTPATPAAAIAAQSKSGHPGFSHLEPPDEGTTNAHKRYAAGLYYSTDLRGVTLERLNRHPMFKDVSLRTLKYWSAEDRWVDRRKANLEKWRKAIENKIGTEMIKARMGDLADMRNIYGRMLTKLKSKALKARSYEGMVSAFTKLADLMDQWGERLSKEFVPDMPIGEGGLAIGAMAHETKPQLTLPEARAAAKAVLTQRRQEMRAKRAREEAEAAGEERPQLQVVEGEL